MGLIILFIFSPLYAQSLNEPINLSSINSPYGDFAPYISADGRTMYFSSSRPGGMGGEDIWVTRFENLTWTAPKPVGEPINSPLNEGSVCISSDGHLLIFTVCYDKNSYGSCDLYFSIREKNSWSKPENMGSPINTPYWEGHPSLTADGKRLYFASNRKGGYGGIDLYWSDFVYGKWTEPKNLKYPINTARDEISPFIHADGKTLYFSSSGHGGYGGFDVFKVTMDENGNWGEIINLGPPINTSGDDYFFSVPASGEFIYISSDRPGGLGDRDIYAFPLAGLMKPSIVVTISGKVVDKYTSQPLKARLTVENLYTREKVAQVESNRDDGGYYIVLPWGSLYGITVEVDSYAFLSTNFDLTGEASYKEYTLDFELQPIRKGENIVLNNIFFDFDKSELRPESYPELDRVVELMKTHPTMKIELRGYCDSIGTREYNLKLSERRANAVKEYLVSKGIESDRLETRGFGSDNPVAPNTTEEGRQKNRRTEFHIIKE